MTDELFKMMHGREPTDEDRANQAKNMVYFDAWDAVVAERMNAALPFLEATLGDAFLPDKESDGWWWWSPDYAGGDGVKTGYCVNLQNGEINIMIAPGETPTDALLSVVGYAVWHGLGVHCWPDRDAGGELIRVSVRNLKEDDN